MEIVSPFPTLDRRHGAGGTVVEVLLVNGEKECWWCDRPIKDLKKDWRSDFELFLELPLMGGGYTCVAKTSILRALFLEAESLLIQGCGDSQIATTQHAIAALKGELDSLLVGDQSSQASTAGTVFPADS